VDDNANPGQYSFGAFSIKYGIINLKEEGAESRVK